jgi:redox-sensitive bicupin YhaK (pirin superfamily)
LAYIIAGQATFDDNAAAAQARDLVLLSRNGESVRIANTGSTPLSLLLIGGEPIGEPVARYGPFVMNSREELYEAFEDFRSGKMGRIG